MKSRESFAFYRSFMDAIELLPTHVLKARAYKVICEYGLNGIEPQENENVDFVVKIIFKQAKPQIDKSIKRYDNCVENGRLGGAPKGNSNASKNKQETTNKQPNELNGLNENDLNYNDNYKGNENYNYNEKENDNKEIEKENKDALETLSKKFKHLKLNCNFDCKKYDLNKIVESVLQSSYLQKATLTFIFENYEKVISGYYQDFKKNVPSRKLDFETMFDDLGGPIN